MPLYSYSQLNTYENCPLHYKFRYRDRIKRAREGVEAFLGQMVHATLEKCYNDARLTRSNTLEELLAYYNRIWEQNWHDEIAIVREGLTAEHYRAQGIEMLGRYYRRYAPFNTDITLGTEVRLNFKLDESSRYSFIGYVDRLSRAPDEVYEIQDYKTGGRLPTQAESDADRQLALYQLGIRQLWPDITAVRLVWYYLAFDQRLVSTRSEAALAELERQVKEAVDEIAAATDFPPRESALCEWCEYPDLCPVRKHHFKVAEMPPAEAVREPGLVLVDRYAALKEKSARLDNEIAETRAAIVDYAQRESAEVVRGSGHQVKIKLDRKLKFPGKNDADRGKLDGIIRHAGRWDELSQLDTTALERVLRDQLWDEALRDDIGRYASEEETSTVTLSGLKEKLDAEADE